MRPIVRILKLHKSVCSLLPTGVMTHEQRLSVLILDAVSSCFREMAEMKKHGEQPVRHQTTNQRTPNYIKRYFHQCGKKQYKNIKKNKGKI